MDKESKANYIVRFWNINLITAEKVGEIEVTSLKGESFEETLERYKSEHDNDIHPIPENWNVVRIYKLVEAGLKD